MLAVNQKPLVKSEVVSREHFQFRNDSAGLGVPRGDFGKLNKVAEHVQQHGTVNQQVYFTAPAQTLQGGHPTSTAVMAGSIHRGAAPPPSMGAGNAAGNPGGNVGGNPGQGNMGGYSGRSGGPSGPSMSGAPAPTHSAPPPSQAPSSMGTGRPR